ncbi:MAG: chromosome segregation protein SMC [Candidatus Omnitrophota bacterium]|nr:chromosome segregation protein SMC [Candidatus Omnitrophota bacterium]
MYFKYLELMGFKSFAEKTKLNFEPGVTAVVGPNGCGKSNIADGIRWVLGEQSAKTLRASNMQDVIFNGTDTKEPINFAEVSLTFSNEKRVLPIDYDEVTITRRVFRTGETEYLLNKTPVRLKDISELLMGTGIGAESYSIIEQGKMDLILSSKPEDRRFVFEEASGITKYKSKKKEALRKLEQTEQNLLRINDIIQEVKRQIASIERQARKAEKYKADFDRLKDVEIKVSYYDYMIIKTQEATCAAEKSDISSCEKDADAQIRSGSEKIYGYRQSMDEMNQKISDLRNKNTEQSGLLDMNTHKIDINKERIEENRSIQDGLRKEIASAGEKIMGAKALVEKLKEGLARVSGERVSKHKSLEEKEILLKTIANETEAIEAGIKTCKVRAVDYLAKETRLKNELIKIGADVQNRRARKRRLDIEKDKVGAELESLEGALTDVIREFEEIEKRVLSLRMDLDSNKGRYEDALSGQKVLEEEIAREGNRITAAKSKIEILEDSLKTHEGFKNSVRNILTGISERKENSLSGIRGVLADIIKVERGYEEAVSAFLGDDAEIIIVDTDEGVETAIEYLRLHGLGKASFISIETLKNQNRVCRQEVPQEGKTPLKNFVKVDPAYEDVRGHFFADAYLAESAKAIFNNLRSSGAVRLVTKSGYTFDNCKVSGGSASLAVESLLVGRRERLEDLKAETIDKEQNMASLESVKSQKAGAAALLKQQITALEEGLHAQEIIVSNIKAKKDGLEGAVKKLKEERELLTLELDEVDQAIDELTKKGESFNAELNNIEKEKAASQAFMDESQVSISKKREDREILALEMATLKTELVSFEKEEEGTRNSMKQEASLLFELEDTLYSKESMLKESEDKVKFLEEESVKLAAENEVIKADLETNVEKACIMEKARSDCLGRLGADEACLKEKEMEIERLRNQARDLDVKLTEFNYRKTNLRDRIFQAYKVDFENTHCESEEPMDWDALRTQVAELKDRIDKMGPVNLVAIEEHKELEERRAFLTHQEEDLVNAKDSLLKAIQKINKTTKELFLDTFQKIQLEFKNFFRMLFGGGQAELVLIDEHDVLESGIEIIVRPPGKKLQNIMLLSGGEKAMTAIALLFAIFKVRPSPFCVLDEIDAPLDESNVLRFSNVLKDFLKISQFIIITHNKRTIELADVMYGITMQERGVSKIVSVKFLDENKNVESKEKESVLTASPAS